ncbi:transporter [Gammaproteobacteria bacterium 42_54_T18]|nr:transporter [Gammaproteobacteria bacterium 42_54_T18]
MLNIYNRFVLSQPKITLLLVSLVIAFFAYQSPNFKLDASADSLVLENDSALEYYRAIRARYGSDDSLILTYTPSDNAFKEGLFGTAALSHLRSFKNDLSTLSRVKSITSLLDVPLIQSPPVTLNELQKGIITLESPQVDIALAKKEFVTSALYRNLIISPDGKTTALQIQFRRDETWHRLLDQRDALREKKLNNTLLPNEQQTLDRISQQFDAHNSTYQQNQKNDIATIRSIIKTYQQKANIHLGGVPMIASDSTDFIQHDLMTFGVGVICFMIAILTVTFRKLRWVSLPMFTCLAAGIIMIGFLAFVNWPVTVVSSNFISLLLIITLSLSIHLIVRYRELQEQSPNATQHTLIKDTIRSKAAPCFYTAITTIVAFGSLLFSGIRPIIDFGWMMTIGISVAFILVFTLFPATLLFLKPGESNNKNAITDKITLRLAGYIKDHSSLTFSLFIFLAIFSAIGINNLTVENRFIDYFKKNTEIYQGMALIDRKLGGTTPLDVIIDAPSVFFEVDENEDLDSLEDDEDWEEDFDDDFGTEAGAGITGTSYWFNTRRFDQIFAIHKYLDELPETGKVLSIATALETLRQIDEDVVSDDFTLAILYKKLPQEIKQSLIEPYMSEDGNQLRFSIRVFESDPSLQRKVLLEKIQRELTQKMQLEEDQVHLTGMLVLYNNMLQSLFHSQILTLGVVFFAILIMFVMLFRNIKMALITIIPNLIAAALILGLMGWSGIPLDMMTITIAAISIGIGVDNSIHYVHRVTDEFYKDLDYWGAINRSHASIGRAMYYTTVTITLGFSILAMSNFVPTMYFGLLTGVAMMAALFANLTLLPLLIASIKPLNPLHPEPSGS